MQDTYIQVNKLVTAGLWTSAYLMIGSAWAISAMWSWHVAVMLGFTAMLILAAAVASQVQCYALRICAVLRATREDPRESRDLHVL